MKIRCALLCLLMFTLGCGGAGDAPASAPPGGATPGATAVAPPPPTAFSQTDLVVGTGAEAARFMRITVDYSGWVYDASKPEQKGTLFDTSAGRGPYEFNLGAGDVIAGWDRGFDKMRVGGKRRLIIPPELGYGADGGGPIPPNAGLVFEMELLGVR